MADGTSTRNAAQGLLTRRMTVNKDDSHVLSMRRGTACVLMGDNSSARIERKKEPVRVHATRQTTAGVVLFLCCYTAAFIPVNRADRCFPSGPETCGFENIREGQPNVTDQTSCSWANTNFRFLRNDQHVYLQLDPGQPEGRLTSRTGCRQTSPGCLSFLYFFDVNDTVDLSVAVRYDGYETPAVWMASSSSFSSWSEATVPIATITGNFQVVIKAKRRRQSKSETRSSVFQRGSAFLDEIQYDEQQSRCRLKPMVTMTTALPNTQGSTSSGFAAIIAVSVTVVVVVIVVVAVVTRVVVKALLRRVRAKEEICKSEDLASLNSQRC